MWSNNKYQYQSMMYFPDGVAFTSRQIVKWLYVVPLLYGLMKKKDKIDFKKFTFTSHHAAMIYEAHSQRFPGPFVKYL